MISKILKKAFASKFIAMLSKEKQLFICEYMLFLKKCLYFRAVNKFLPIK